MRVRLAFADPLPPHKVWYEVSQAPGYAVSLLAHEIARAFAINAHLNLEVDGFALLPTGTTAGLIRDGDLLTVKKADSVLPDVEKPDNLVAGPLSTSAQPLDTVKASKKRKLPQSPSVKTPNKGKQPHASSDVEEEAPKPKKRRKEKSKKDTKKSKKGDRSKKKSARSPTPTSDEETVVGRQFNEKETSPVQRQNIPEEIEIFNAVSTVEENLNDGAEERETANERSAGEGENDGDSNGPPEVVQTVKISQEVIESIENDDKEDETPAKPKRKKTRRRPKKKNANPTEPSNGSDLADVVTAVQDTLDPSALPSNEDHQITQPTSMKNSNKKKGFLKKMANAQRTHIRFDEGNDENVEGCSEQANIPLEYEPPLPEPRCILTDVELEEENANADRFKNGRTIYYPGTQAEPRHVAPSYDENTVEGEIQNYGTLIDYSSLPLLTRLPDPMDTIAYKVLEMSAAYTPEISDFKEATVLAVNEFSRALVLRIAPHSRNITIGDWDGTTPRRFELRSNGMETDEDNMMSYEESLPQSEEVVTIQFEELFEPKMVSSNAV